MAALSPVAGVSRQAMQVAAGGPYRVDADRSAAAAAACEQEPFAVGRPGGGPLRVVDQVAQVPVPEVDAAAVEVDGRERGGAVGDPRGVG